MSSTQTTQGAVIITGGAHGIGAAYVDRLSADGYPVAIADLDEAGAQAKAKEVIAAGGKALAVKADISVEADVAGLVEATVAEFGTITGLVNNAAVFSVVPMSRGTFAEIELDEWDLMMRVNLRGTWQMCKAVTPHMAENGYGKIVNVSSGTAIKGSAGRIHYVTSKAGILGFTKTLAREVGADGIRVNCVAPGSTLSEEDPDEKTVEYRKSRVGDRALGRVQMPEDLAGAVAFFISTDSDFVTGQTLVVDGGSCMH